MTRTACCGNLLSGRRALRFDADGWLCVQHMGTEQRARVEAADRSTQGKLGKRGWPYGADGDVETRERLAAWINRHNLRRSDNDHECLNWLDDGACRTRECNPGRRGWRDHISTWINDTHRVFVSHPYRLSKQDRDELRELERSNPTWEVETAPDGWYGHGTWQITLWSPRTPARHATRKGNMADTEPNGVEAGHVDVRDTGNTSERGVWPSTYDYAVAQPCPQCRADVNVPCDAPQKQAQRNKRGEQARRVGATPNRDPLLVMHTSRADRGVRQYEADLENAPWPEDRDPRTRYDTLQWKRLSRPCQGCRVPVLYAPEDHETLPVLYCAEC